MSRSSIWLPMNQTRLEKYGAAVLSRIYRSIAMSLTETDRIEHAGIAILKLSTIARKLVFRSFDQGRYKSVCEDTDVTYA